MEPEIMETHEVAVVERNENGMKNLLSKEYSPLTLRPPISVADLGKDIIGLHHIYGYDSSRKGNLHFIEDDKLVFVDGSSVVLENIHDGTREFLLDVSECGAACVAVHPSRYVCLCYLWMNNLLTSLPFLDVVLL